MSLTRRPVEPEDELYYDDDELEPEPYSDEAPQPDRRQVWIRRLFWVGTALAPIAAVLLVMGQGVNPLRAAAALAIIGVVCIGLSVTLRDNSSSAHAELAEDLQHEVDEVRAELDTLRRGVQLTVNRELGRVRGELEAAQQVMHAEATRLPARSGRTEPEPVSSVNRTHQSGVGQRAQAARVSPLAEPSGALPIPPQLPSGSVYGDAAYSRRGAAPGFDVNRPENGSAGRGGGYGDYDPLSSTASHRIVSRAGIAHRDLPDPHTVEPIRERYSSSQVPAPRSSSGYSGSESSFDYGASSSTSSRLTRGGRRREDQDVLFGDVLPPQRSSGDSDGFSWANSAPNSTSTQDWTPDFDLPSLDGLPAPGYASASQERSVGGRSSGRRRQEISGHGSQSNQGRHAGRHSASSDDNDAFWNR